MNWTSEYRISICPVFRCLVVFRSPLKWTSENQTFVIWFSNGDNDLKTGKYSPDFRSHYVKCSEIQFSDGKNKMAAKAI
jgi:hypothetical protein